MPPCVMIDVVWVFPSSGARDKYVLWKCAILCAPWPGQRRETLVPSERHEFDVGASDTPHCGCEHAKQSREEEATPAGHGHHNPEEDAMELRS